MGLFDKLRKEQPSQESPREVDNPLATIMKSGKIAQNGTLQKVDMKQLSSGHIVSLVKAYRSLEEQNRHLQKYLKEMVSENEDLQGQLKDTRMTLSQAKKSLGEVTNDLANLKASKKDESEEETPMSKPHLQKINTVRKIYDKQREEMNTDCNDDKI